MKHFIYILALAMAACTSTPQPATTDFDRDGRVVRTTVVMSSEDHADSQIARHKADCQRQYYGVSDKVTDTKDLALLTAIQALNPNDPCPTVTTNKDVEIAKNQGLHSTVQTFLNKIPILGGIAGGAYVGGKAVENRDPPEPVIVEQPEPIIVQPPEPIIIEAPSSSPSE